MKHTSFLISLTLTFSLFTIQIFAQLNKRGCKVNLDTKPNDFYVISNYTGNQQLDSILQKQVSSLKSFFSVQPSFFIYEDDSITPSVQAMKTIENDSFPSGTILLGLNMVKNELTNPNKSILIPLILAHQFAHISDFTKNSTPIDDLKSTELFAEFQTGCFLFHNGIQIDSASESTILNFFEKKEYELNNQEAHGIPLERLAALKAGYEWLKSKAQLNFSATINEAELAAQKYLGLSSIDKQETLDSIAANVSILTNSCKSYLEGVHEMGFSYRITIDNKNDVDLIITIGGLCFGRYQKCDYFIGNYIYEGEFDLKAIRLAAHTKETITISKSVYENWPVDCPGVYPNQKAKIISIKKE
jgi:hypothetical protein